jgi:aryl-alcohol dehydrogenase-like predicted oxidoreductase
VTAAWDAGIRYFDIAPTTGCPARVGTEAFVARDDVRREWDFSRDGVLRSIEETLQRTGLDRLDVVYLHDQSALDDVLPVAQAMGEGVVAAGVFNSGLLAAERPAAGPRRPVRRSRHDASRPPRSPSPSPTLPSSA